MFMASKAELGCWSGGRERWGAAWWDNDQHLSPINALYLSPSCCTVITYSHRLTIWWLHLFLYGIYFMKIVFCCRPPLFISFQVQGSLGRSHHVENSSFVAGLASLCRVSLFPILLFWFYFRNALSSISLSLLVNEWTFLAMAWSFGFVKCKSKKKKAPAKRKHFAWKTALWYWGPVAPVPLFPWASL